MSPNESVDADITSFPLSPSVVKCKITSGEFKLSNKRSKSKIWNVFAKIENKTGEEVPKLVICRICNNIYKYNSASTSNLSRHKCYVASVSIKEVGRKVQADPDIKENIVNIITEWVIDNCRSCEVVEDSGFKKLVEFLLSVGEKFGRNMELNSLLPKPATIYGNINKIYNNYSEKIKSEITSIKSIGFGVTAEVYNDNYLKKLYIAVTIHYINEGNLTSRILGLKPTEGEDFTLKIRKILKEYDLEFDDKSIIVTKPDINMIEEFRENNHILCINHLLYNALEKSMQEVQNISELSDLCNKLVSHFEITYPDAALISTLKSFPPYHWNKIYNLYVAVEKNWSEIVQLLKQKNELITSINLKHITSVIEVLKPFQETFDKLQGDYATIHLVYVYVNRLKKKCNHSKTDLEMIKQLKEKLSSYLDSMVLNKLTLYHKIGLFLFPPANQLLQFSEDEKLLIKDECKRIMKSYLQDIPEVKDENVMVMSGISNDNSELFSDFVVNSRNIKFVDKITNEILLYENKTVIFYDDFNILQWWNLHKHEFPLLYKVSCKIFATPASCAASAKLCSLARNLFSEEKTDIVSNNASINEIIFLHSNIGINELQKDFFKCLN